jgi:hypothetical protein
MERLRQNLALKAAANDIPRITMGTVPGTVREVIAAEAPIGICGYAC